MNLLIFIGIGIGIGIGRELNRCRSFPGVHVLFKGAHVFRRERPGPVVQVGRGLIPSRVSKGQSLGEAVITTCLLATVPL